VHPVCDASIQWAKIRYRERWSNSAFVAEDFSLALVSYLWSTIGM